jgi:hypothetical protein
MRKLLVTLVLLLLPMRVGSQDVKDVTVYGQRVDFYAGYFQDVVERVVFISCTGHIYAFTTMEEHRVLLPISLLEEVLAKDGLEIKDLAVVVHNHWARPMFSEPDLAYFMELYKRGFRGAFVLYHQASGKTLKKLWGHDIERIKVNMSGAEW